MRISKFQNTPNFKGILNNKLFLSGLEKISDHPAGFAAGASFLMSSLVRPLAIALTPKTDNENKKYAISQTLSSAFAKFAIAELVALPVENSVNKIANNPEKFLKKETIENFKDKANTISKSKNFQIANQLIKNVSNIITALPKSAVSVLLIPIFMNKIFNKHDDKNYRPNIPYNPVFDRFYKDKINFTSLFDKSVCSVLNSSSFQKLINTNNFKEADIARNSALLSDILLCSSSVIATKKSKKIKDDKKNPLIYNKIITTAISIFAGCKIDKSVQNGTKKFVENFKTANSQNPKLEKYIEGINVLRPTIVFAFLYYGILPMFSIFTADKADKFINQKRSNNVKEYN